MPPAAVHPFTQLDGLGNGALRSLAFRLRFHRKMQHDLIAAAIRFFGDVGGKRQVRQDGNRQWKRQREQRIGGGAVVTQIIENDRKLCGSLRVLGRKARTHGQRHYNVNRVRASSMGGEIETNDAALGSLRHGEPVALRNFGQCLS